MAKKKQAVAIVAQHIRDGSLTDARRLHAATTLETISGRRFHSETKLDEAQWLLQRRGQ